MGFKESLSIALGVQPIIFDHIFFSFIAMRNFHGYQILRQALYLTGGSGGEHYNDQLIDQASHKTTIQIMEQSENLALHKTKGSGLHRQLLDTGNRGCKILRQALSLTGGSGGEHYNYQLIDQASHKTTVQIMEQSGKALHSGKNAEKRRSEAIKRELLVLVHDFLTEEGLFEGIYLLVYLDSFM